MADYNISAAVRAVVGKKVNRLRNEGFIPGTVYGPKTPATNLQFGAKELDMTLRAAGGTHLININVENGETYSVVARDVQRHIIKGNILHVDFFAVDMSAKIRAEVPVSFIGENAIVAARKGIMLTGPNTLTLEMLPGNMIDHITIDISKLTEIGSAFAVKDLSLGDDITIINDPEEMIAKIVQPSAARSEERATEEGAEAATTEDSED